MENKIIVISGGSSGLGLAFAKELNKDNKVIILSRSKNKLEEVSKENNLLFKVCNIVDSNQVEKVANEIKEEHGKVDVLINNAGIWLDGNLEEHTYEQIQNVIDINLVGQIFLTKAMVPLLKESKKGLIVNTNSRAGKTTREDLCVYNASKWGLRAFSSALRSNIEKDNVSVLDLFPAGINTELFDKANSPRDLSNFLDPKVIAKVVKNNIELYFDCNTVIEDIDFRQLS